MDLSPDNPLWDRIPCGLVIADRQGQVRAANPPGSAVLGRLLPDQDRAAPRTLAAIPAIAEAIQTALGTRDVGEVTIALAQAPDGLATEVRAVCARHDQDTVLIVLNEHSRVEAGTTQTQSQEQRFRILARLANDWFWSTDADDRFVVTYDEAGRLQVTDEAIGRRRADFLDTREAPGDFPEIEAAVTARRAFRNRVYPQRQVDNTTRWVSVSGTPQFDANGRYVGYAGTAVDVSRQVRAELKLQRAAAELEAQVQSRTRDLQQALDKHRAAEVAAAQANRDKSLFLGAVSFDLRQPLQTAVTCFGLLGRSAGVAANRDPYLRLGESLGELVDRIEQLLDVARIDNAAMEVRRQTFSLNQLLTRLAEKLTPIAEARRIDLDIPGSDCTVHSDPFHCERILLNVLDSAVRVRAQRFVRMDVAVAEDGVTVSITHDGDDPSAGAVAQDGPTGWALDAPGTQARGGDLALAIGERLAGLLGHGWTVTARPGGGGVVAIEMPLGAADPEVVEYWHAMPDPGFVPTAPGPRGRIVVVIDDDPGVLASLCAAISDLGHTPLGAKSLDDALSQLVRVGTGDPDLVLADQWLSDGRTGTEAIAVLRQVYGSGLPALILTGDSAVLAAAATSSVRILEKPIAADVLRQAIDGAIRDRQAAGSGPA